MSRRVDAALRAAVDGGAAPMVVGIAADYDGVVYEGAAGPRTVGSDEPVSVDSVFRIASMTKIVCTVAALALRDSGGLDFAAPVDTYCPDFADLLVLDGFADDRPILRPPATRATVRQLVTHTAGLAYGFWNADLRRWAGAGHGGLFTTPLVADPGRRFEYGIATDWLGRVVQAASGQSLDDHLAARVFAPLGMTATAFRLNGEQRARCVPVHVRDGGGGWTATDFDWDPRPDHWPAGHGLYSTPRDFLRFQRMLLDGGAPILRVSTVREAFTNQIGPMSFPARIHTADPAWSSDFLAGPGHTWGWGLFLRAHGRPAMRRAGSGGWAGAFNTYFWVDPAARLTAAFYTQCLPFVDPPVVRACDEFERALYADR
ncbi:serine hydrolase [Asanoa sp. WMMD1127]|uniref:serine hydrolase domain-containing protein n=1 Tax=Asanoa sp. WMMD1127 TaxID=3016107 RepID=UPI00241665E2|nr:serine hydrolase domain-containing protein [Asanoa sp. WMMD1127]MDG4825881.1 serine hydrolase [Asanoa sp. WMMD1127]